MKLKNIIENFLDYKNLTYFGFFLLVYTSFWGAKLPFNYEAGAKDGSASNPINQLLYFLMFSISAAVAIIKSETIFSFLKKEKFLSLFILFCLLSVAWASFPSYSLRRVFQLFVTFIVSVESVLFLSNEKMFHILRKILIFYILLTFFAILFIPDAIDPLFGTPRGLTLQKNQFGQIFNIILLIFLMLLKLNQVNKYRYIDYLAIFISIIFIVLSASTTAFLSMLYILALQIIFFSDKIFKNLRIGKVISLTIIITIFTISLLLSFNSGIVETIVSQYLGKDLTFTGRTEIWTAMLVEIMKHPYLGVGYSSYWDVPTKEFSYSLIGNTAHNGYLEILNELGVIGFILMFVVFISFFYRSAKLSSNLYTIAIVSILILNFSESSLFREKGAITFLTVWTILLSSKEFLQQKFNKYFTY